MIQDIHPHHRDLVESSNRRSNHLRFGSTSTTLLRFTASDRASRQGNAQVGTGGAQALFQDKTAKQGHADTQENSHQHQLRS